MNLYKPTTIDKIIRSKEREVMKGWVEAELDFEAVCAQYRNDFGKLYEYMKSRYIQDGEAELLKTLIKTDREEKVIGQIKRMRQLHKKFMKYAEKIHNQGN